MREGSRQPLIRTRRTVGRHLQMSLTVGESASAFDLVGGMHRIQGRVTAPCVIACGLVLGLAACGGSTNQAVGGSSSDGGNGSADVGSINAEFQLPSGTASMASYTLTGPNNFSRTDTLDFDGSQAIGFLIDDVPPGDGYTLSVMASSDGGEVCDGSTSLTVTAQMTTPVDVTAQCTGAPYVPTGYGALEVWATLPSGISFAGAEFVLQGPAGVEDTDAVAVDGAGLHFILQQVPAGPGQMLSLTAVANDNLEKCTATSTFAITANQTAEVMLTPTCH